MATASFSAPRHEYECDGVLVPSVTQIIELAGLEDLSRIPRRNLQRAAARGQAVHDATRFLDEDDLDLDSLEPEIVGHVLGYQRFKAEHKFFPLSIEQRGIGEVGGLKFGYTVDRTGMIESIPVLIDIKTSAKASPTWQVQTAGYTIGTNLGGLHRLVVHTSKDGAYRLLRHNEQADFSVFFSALQIAHWKLAHGGKLPR